MGKRDFLSLSLFSSNLSNDALRIIYAGNYRLRPFGLRRYQMAISDSIVFTFYSCFRIRFAVHSLTV